MTENPEWMASHKGSVTIALDEPSGPATAEGFAATARWIGRDNPEAPATVDTMAPAPLLRRAVRLPAGVERAELRIAGFGYCHAEVNGRAVGDGVLDPPPSQYDRTVFARVFDVTDLLVEGANALGVVLGRGYVSGIGAPSATWTSEPRVLAQLDLTLADGRELQVISDDRWRMADSAIRDWMYYGESHDARAEQPGWSRPGFDDSSWSNAPVQDWPTSRVLLARTPPVRVMDTFAPVGETAPAEGVTVYDFGRITAGWTRIRVRGAAGTTLRISYGQQLDEHGRVALFAPRLHVDHYTLAGSGDEEWEPRFVRHGFRFVEIAVVDGGPAELRSVQARESYTAVTSTGTFATSNPLLDTIHENHRRSLLLNHWGFPTDTAGRDRQGWTSDTALYLDSAVLNFAGLRPLYEDWLLTLRDTQQADGSVSVFAPDSYEVPFFNDPSWSGMLVMIPWALHQHYGDLALLRDNYAAMTAWMDLMDRLIAETGDLYAGFSFGDHSPPGAEDAGTVALSPPEGSDITRNAHLFLEARTLADIARLLGDDAAGKRYDAMADRIRTAFTPAYFDPAAGEYRTPTQTGYRQTSNVMPLACGIVPDEHAGAVFANLVADLEGRGDRLDTGSIGTKRLLPLLTRYGRADLAYRIATQTAYPSWGYWVTQGATSSWETWSNRGPEQTLDHPFLGTVDDWFYQHLAGIQPAEPGYAAVRIAPVFAEGLHHVSATVTTPRGVVGSAWSREDGAITLTVTQPAGVTSTIVLPHGADRVTVVSGAAEREPADGGDTDGGDTGYRSASQQVVLRVGGVTG